MEEKAVESAEAKRQRLREARRRKILQNAKSRMDRVLSSQQQFEPAAEEGVEEKERVSDADGGGTEERERLGESLEPSHPTQTSGADDILDPPDELLSHIIPPPQHLAPDPLHSNSSPPPPLLAVWVAVLHTHHRMRAVLVTLTGIIVALTAFQSGWTTPSLLYMMTSELCLMAGALWYSHTHRGQNITKATHGTVVAVRVVLNLLYPPASQAMDYLLPCMQLCWVWLQDLVLCVSSFIATVVISKLIIDEV